MKNIIKEVRPAIVCILIFTVVCGLLYTGIITGIGQFLFPDKANGSIITVTLSDGTKQKAGSELIAQEFTKPEYLIGRPMGTSNLSPTSDELRKLAEERMKWWKAFDPGNKKEIPADLIYGSGSGADPNISPEAAQYQVSRIALARGLDEKIVEEIIRSYTTKRYLGIFGEPSVNVLKVNLALDGKYK